MRWQTLRSLFLALVLLFAASEARAQDGSIRGRATDAETGDPLVSARVDVLAAGTSVAGGFTDEDGRFVVPDLDPGTYSVVVSMVGYRDYRAENVRVAAGQAVNVIGVLRADAVSLNPVVVTASRQREKALEAPATVAVVDVRAIEERPTLTPVDHLRSVPGVDIITHGLQATNVVSRGFNNIFSSALHTLTDYRIASIPSLRANLLHFVPANNEDIERVEVVMGPGAALYGPNTANGVVHFMTRSPLEHQGTTVTLAGGERNTFQTAFRTAHRLSDNFGLKVSGQYLQGVEWRFTDPTEYAARQRILFFDPDTKIGLRDFNTKRVGAEVRADWRATEDATAVFSAGYTDAISGVELTGVGAGQTQNWKYAFVQARASWRRLFVQSYLNMSDAGETYLLRTGQVVKDNSKFWVSQVQHGFNLGTRQNFTYGADALLTRPDTEGEIHGRNEDNDKTNEFGAYVQSETVLTSKLDLVLAGRVDTHTRLDNAIFSPRAALVFKPVENQNFRLTYNRAFSTPVSFNLYLDLPAGPAPGAAGDVLGFHIRAMGTEPTGFTFVNPDSSFYGMQSPFAEQIGQTDATVLPVNTPTLWDLTVNGMRSLGLIDAATYTFLSLLNPTNEQISIRGIIPPGSRVPLGQVARNIGRVEESLNSQFEVGYKGILGNRLLVNADVWYEKRTNLTSPLTQVSPLALLDSAGVHNTVRDAMLVGGIPGDLAEQRATAIASGMSRFPGGVLTAEQASRSERAEILASYFNAGELDVMGGDLNLTALINNKLTATMGIALVSDDHFEVDGRFVGLNAPKRKGMAAINYRDVDAGYNAELRARYNAEFPVLSAPYNATECVSAITPDVAALAGREPCVKAVTLFDVTLGSRVPRMPGASVQLNVTNVLDRKHQSFVGVPGIGRFALLRVRYEF